MRFTEEQLTFQETVRNFARKELQDDVIRRDRDNEFFWEGWRRCAAFGIHGLPLPAEYGGSGADRLTTALAMEALGYACPDNGLIFSINAHMWSCEMPLLTFGTEKQKAAYLPTLCRGEWVGVHGVTEPDSGSDAFSLKTRAERKEDRYILNGRKTLITNAPIADLVVVFATVDPARGLNGVSAFLLEKGTPGFVVSREIEKMGLRTSPMGELILEDCEVPTESRLGAEGAGNAIFQCSMEWERSCILASQVGVMARQLEACVAYARQRTQFGRPIGKFQLVAGKIADMKIRLETCRAILYDVAAGEKRGADRIMDAAIAKAYISECAVQSALDAIQIHGGYGYTTEMGIERDLRDAVGGRLYSGTSEIQRTIIARGLGL